MTCPCCHKTDFEWKNVIFLEIINVRHRTNTTECDRRSFLRYDCPYFIVDGRVCTSAGESYFESCVGVATYTIVMYLPGSVLYVLRSSVLLLWDFCRSAYTADTMKNVYTRNSKVSTWKKCFPKKGINKKCHCVKSIQ